jgi:MazG family protein
LSVLVECAILAAMSGPVDILPPGAPPGAALAELVEVMRRLLAPDGCPWDREQTLASLRPYLLEESYELLEALDSGDATHHQEELGDLLFQIVFQSALRAAEGAFTIDDVVRGIASKLVRRHPHVFGDAKVKDAAEVLDNWAAQKQKEKARQQTLEGVPRALPALARAQKLTERASHVGFDWPDAVGPRAKIDEELRETDLALAAGDKAAAEAELGDLLFSVVNLARKVGVDAECALRGSVERFESRFAHVELRLAERGRTPRESTLTEMDELWNEAKAEAKRIEGARTDGGKHERDGEAKFP